MGLNANKIKSNNTNRVKQEPLDPGTYPARLVQVLDLGVQPQKPFKGEEKKPAHEIMLTYEFLDEFCVDEKGEVDEDKPRWLSETMPFRSLMADMAKSTKRYRALDPNEDHEGDFTQLTTTACNVTVVNNESGGTVYNNVGNVSAMRPKDAQKAPELKNPCKVFVLDEPDMEIFLSLPQWLQDKIKGNLEFEGSSLQKALEAPQKADKPAPKGKPKVEEEDDVDDVVEGPETDDRPEDDIPW